MENLISKLCEIKKIRRGGVEKETRMVDVDGSIGGSAGSGNGIMVMLALH